MARSSVPRKNTHKACVHHWLCGDEQSGVVHAACAKCGAKTDFAQHVYPFKWDKKDMSYLFSPRMRD